MLFYEIEIIFTFPYKFASAESLVDSEKTEKLNAYFVKSYKEAVGKYTCTPLVSYKHFVYD